MQGAWKKAFVFVSLLGLIGTSAAPVNFTVTPVRAQEAKNRGYLPHLANLMNEAMQVHHTKLWLAGRANNWALAAYETTKIKETIVEVKEAIVEIQTASSQWQHVPVGEMLVNVDSSLDALEQAIKAKDGTQFADAYLRLTAACNLCHTRAGQSQIIIIEPPPSGGSIFADQDFTNGNGSK